MKIELTGDWGKASGILSGAPNEIPKALARALKQEGRHAEGLIKQNIGKGPPPPLAHKRTRGTGKGGSKPLNASGDMRGAVTVLETASFEVFVGIPRNSPKHGGRVCNLAMIHEFGKTIAIRMTPKMRKFLFGVLFKGSKRAPGGGSKSGGGIIVVHIPARPFVAPAFAEASVGFGDRMIARVAKEMGGALG